jgi:predicted nuclease of predicted toxin-antitoxin system
MKLLFDENLSARVAVRLNDVYSGSIHVRDVGLKGGEDWEIWNHAANDGFVIASRDSDFRQLSLLRGHPPKVVVVAIGNCTNKRLEALFRSYHQELADFESHATRAMIVLT